MNLPSVALPADQPQELGVRHPRPLLALDILTTGAIPHLRLTPLGYVRLRDGALLGLTDPA